MAQSDKIKHSDIIENDIFKNSQKSAEEFNLALLDLAEGFKVVQKEATSFLKVNKDPKSAEELKKVNENINKSVLARKSLAEVDKQLLAIQKENEALQKKILALEKQQLESKEKNKKANKELSDSQKAQSQLNAKDTRDRVKQLQLIAIAQDENRGKLERLNAEIALNRMSVQKLKETDANYESELKRLNEEIDKQVELQKSLIDKQSKNRAEVGNYTESVKDAINQSELLNDAFGQMTQSNQTLVQGFQMLRGNLGKIKEALSGADTVGKKFGLTLKALGIAAIISALASLGAFFTSSRNGANELRLIMARINATISVLVGTLSVAGGAIVNLFKNMATVMSPVSLALTVYREGWDGLVKKFTESKDDIEKIVKAFKGFNERIEKSIDATVKLTEETIAYENALRGLSLTQLKLNMDVEDYNEISADETRTLKERNKALNDGIKARKESAEIGVQIAEKEQKLAFEAVLNSLRNQKVSEAEIEILRKKGAESLLTNDIINKGEEIAIEKLQEKVKATLEAEDALADLPRQEAKRLREKVQNEQALDIELILKKKLNAQEEIVILTKQIEDEKIQLSERAKFIEELRSKELASSQAQFDIFNQKINEENKENKKGDAELKERVDFQDLINTKDAVVLAKKISTLKVSQNQQELVAKIVADAQNNEIANNERLLKQQADLVALKEREQEIEAKTAEINRGIELDNLKSLEDEKLKQLDDYNKQALEKENLFNEEVLKERKRLYEETDKLRQNEFDSRTNDLKEKANQDKIEAERNITEPTERAKKIEQIETQLNRDLNNLAIEKRNKDNEANQKELEILKQIKNKRIEQENKIVQDLLSTYTDYLNKRADREQTLLDRQIDKRQTNIERQTDLASRGLQNQLAFEEQQLAKAELKRQQLAEEQARKQEIIDLTKTYFNFLNAELQKPNANTGTAIFNALGQTALSKGVAKGIASFYTGTEKVENDLQGHKVHSGFDGYNINVDGTERIMTGSQNTKVGNLSNDELADLAFNYRTGNLLPLSQINEASNNIQKGTAQNIYSSLLLQKQDKTNMLLEELIAKPVQQVHVDSFSNLVETIQSNTEKVVITHKTNLKPRIK